jgi:creatinase
MSMPDIIELANGQKVKGTFSSHEMQRRLSGLRPPWKQTALMQLF